MDGEGVDRPDGTHEYIMLSVGPKTLFVEGNVLSLQQILSFLWECFTDQPNAIYVGFFLGYDFTQWFKQLDQETARLLFTTKGIEERKSRNPHSNIRVPQPVVWEGWELDVLAGRRVKLRKHHHRFSSFTGECRVRSCGTAFTPGDPFVGEPSFDPRSDCRSEKVWMGSGPAFWAQFQRKETREWMYICDTGPFWQTSFLNVINPKGWTEPVCSEEEYQIIVEGKADRGITVEHGDTSYVEDMRRYNVLENDVLSRVTARLDKGFRNEHIPIALAKSDWYGPGRAAQKWMDTLHALMADNEAISRNRERTKLNDRSVTYENEYGIKNADVYMSMPTWFADASRESYYGGWFEIFMHGHVGNVWEYDINSAYPFIIASLPCLHVAGGHNGVYRQGKGNPESVSSGDYVLVFGTVTGSDQFIGAAPHRTKTGNILRPHVTKGWYWQHEIDASKRAGLVDSIDVEEWVAYTPCNCTTPFNPADIGIERMYNLRLEVGKNSPQGKGFKLVYNSAYGKTAQSIGQPKYSNPVYASLITAGCRTLILDAIATHPQRSASVAMVATDGVYFTSPHPSLTLDPNRLGAWDEVAKTGMTLFMPGVYWDDKTREKIKTGDTPSLKSRGINAHDLADQIESLDNLFTDLHQELAVNPGAETSWPSIEFRVRFLLESCKSALNRNDWGSAGRIVHGATRQLSSSPHTKRKRDPYLDEDTYVVRTAPYPQGPDSIDSLPYPKLFGQTNNQDFFPGHVGREGDDGMQYWRDLMKGI